MGKPSFSKEEILIDKILLYLFNDGAYKSQYLSKILPDDDISLSIKEKAVLYNKMRLNDLATAQRNLDGYTPEKEVITGYYYYLTENSKKILEEHGSYLNYLIAKKKKERSERFNTKGERVLKYVSAFFAIGGTIAAVIFGIKSSNKTIELRSSKEEVKHLITERDSLIRLTSTPQKPQDPKSGLQQPIDTNHK